MAFFECGLCYNTNDVCPQLSEAVFINEQSPTILEKESDNCAQPITLKSKKVLGPNKAKPFKVGELYFSSFTSYENYRDSIGENRKKFPCRSTLRVQLRKVHWELTSDIRYLTEDEIKEAHKNDLFYKPGT
jgi:hypothetical protein